VIPILLVVLAAVGGWLLWDHFLAGDRGGGIGAGYVGVSGDGYTATCWNCGQTAPFDLPAGVGVGDEVVLCCRDCGAEMEATVGELAGSGSSNGTDGWLDDLRHLWHEIATHGISLDIGGGE
jgi:hypothetical protein